MFIKDPDATLDYTCDWSDWLDGDTISTSSWLTAPVGLTQVTNTKTTTTATVWLSGGTVGATYTVTNRIVTNGGRKEDRSFEIVVSQR